MTKTEIKLLSKAHESKSHKTDYYGKREARAAQKLADSGKAKKTSCSGFYEKRIKSGDYVKVFVHTGYIELI